MCADFCSDIKWLRWFLGAAYDKSRFVCADFSPIKNRSDVIQQWNLVCYCHTQYLRYNIGPCALTFGPRKSLSDFFTELLATKKSVVCADLVREAPTTKINRSMCAWHKCIVWADWSPLQSMIDYDWLIIVLFRQRRPCSTRWKSGTGTRYPTLTNDPRRSCACPHRQFHTLPDL